MKPSFSSSRLTPALSNKTSRLVKRLSWSSDIPDASRMAVFLDFDGTITTAESDAKLMTLLGFPKERRRVLNAAILNGSISIRHGFKLMVDEISYRNTYKRALELAKSTWEFDPGFKTFFLWCKENNVTIHVVSSGMLPAIKAALERHLGRKNASLIKIIANDVEVHKDGRFSLVFRHPDSPHGHVKSRALDELRHQNSLLQIGLRRRPPLCVYVGDGVSDMSAAESADLLLVKLSSFSTNDLATHCDRHRIPYKPVHSFFDVLLSIKALRAGTANIGDLLFKDGWERGFGRESIDEEGWTLLGFDY